MVKGKNNLPELPDLNELAKGEKKKKITFSLTKDVYEEVQKFLRKNNVTMSKFIDHYLEETLEKIKKLNNNKK